MTRSRWICCMPKPKKQFHMQSDCVIANSSICDLRKRLDIFNVIGEYVVLNKTANGDRIGRCPFCRPMTSNKKHFRITKKYKYNHIFKCFECGTGSWYLGGGLLFRSYVFGFLRYLRLDHVLRRSSKFWSDGYLRAVSRSGMGSGRRSSW